MRKVILQLQHTLRNAIQHEAEENLMRRGDYIYFCLHMGDKEVELTLTEDEEELNIFASDGRQLSNLERRLEHMLPLYQEAMYEAWKAFN